jgi:hypothetical protein
MMSRFLIRFGCLVFLAWVVVGCARKPSYVTGTVTYEGAPVQSGYITFIPVDGQGASTGGQIVRGKYKVEDVSPGTKRVEIRAGAQLADMPDVDAPKTQPVGKAAPQRSDEELIPPDAEGNNVSVDIGKGNQKIDFPLERPVKKKTEPAAQPPRK